MHVPRAGKQLLLMHVLHIVVRGMPVTTDTKASGLLHPPPRPLDPPLPRADRACAARVLTLVLAARNVVAIPSPTAVAALRSTRDRRTQRARDHRAHATALVILASST
jgi:hypothetical protein